MLSRSNATGDARTPPLAGVAFSRRTEQRRRRPTEAAQRCGRTLREPTRERLAFWRSRNLLGNAKRFLVAGTDAGEMPRTMRCDTRSSCASTNRVLRRCLIHTWYDLASNRTYRQDVVAESYGASFDESYAYDRMQRLIKLNRGTFPSSPSSSSSSSSFPLHPPRRGRVGVGVVAGVVSRP